MEPAMVERDADIKLAPPSRAGGMIPLDVRRQAAKVEVRRPL